MSRTGSKTDVCPKGDVRSVGRRSSESESDINTKLLLVTSMKFLLKKSLKRPGPSSLARGVSEHRSDALCCKRCLPLL